MVCVCQCRDGWSPNQRLNCQVCGPALRRRRSPAISQYHLEEESHGFLNLEVLTPVSPVVNDFSASPASSSYQRHAGPNVLSGQTAITSARHGLCNTCQLIDFDMILSPDAQASGPVQIAPISHTKNSSNCPLCLLFAALHAAFLRRRSGRDHPDMFLWAHSTRYYFATFIEPNAVGAHTIFLSVAPSPRARSIELVLPANGPFNQIYGRPREDQVDWSIVVGWLDSCGRHHDCQRVKTRMADILPLVVIDCTDRQLVQLAHSSKYVALSYIWGNSTAGHNISPSSTCLPSILPRTIEDAMSVTPQLGFRYLWVDRYCIPQEDGPEKHRLIAQMERIYANAAVTICVAYGKDPSQPIPGVSFGSRDSKRSFLLGNHTMVLVHKGLERDLQGSPWRRRGWTFQEEILSPRKLVFTEDQVYFKCGRMTCAETLHEPFETTHDPSAEGLRRSDIMKDTELVNIKDLEALINRYMTRDLSFESDALNAFVGIMDILQSVARHICGHPVMVSRNSSGRMFSSDSDLLATLGWDIKGEARRRTEFPSWTWIGWKPAHDANFYVHSGRVRGYPLSCQWDISLHFEFEHADGHVLSYPWRTAPEQILKAATVRSPVCLRVQGWVFRIRKSEHTFKFQIFKDENNSSSMVGGWISPSLSSATCKTQEFTCLLTSIREECDVFSGIVLCKCGDYFERVGMVSLDSDRRDLTVDIQVSVTKMTAHFRRQEVSIR